MNHKDTKTQRRKPLLFSSLCLGVFVVQIIFEDAMNKNTKLLLILLAVSLVAMLLCCAPLALLVLFRIAMSSAPTTADRPALQADARPPTQRPADLRRPTEQPKSPDPGVHLKKRKGGLEFSRVCVVGVEDHQLPGYTAINEGRDDEIDEARRLLYVAMTRAKDRLCLTYCKERCDRPSGGTMFLKEMGLAEN